MCKKKDSIITLTGVRSRVQEISVQTIAWWEVSLPVRPHSVTTRTVRWAHGTARAFLVAPHTVSGDSVIEKSQLTITRGRVTLSIRSSTLQTVSRRSGTRRAPVTACLTVSRYSIIKEPEWAFTGGRVTLSVDSSTRFTVRAISCAGGAPLVTDSTVRRNSIIEVTHTTSALRRSSSSIRTE